MIKGIGTDLTDRRRIQRAYDRFGDRFVAKVLCATEVKVFQSMGDGKQVAYWRSNLLQKRQLSKHWAPDLVRVSPYIKLRSQGGQRGHQE